MRAFVIPELAGPSAGEVREVPEPVGAHEWADGKRLLVDVHAAGLSFPDLLQSKGLYQHAAGTPYTAGGEAAGVVLEAPEGSRFVPGDRVAGLCLWGAAAERAIVLPQYTVKLPDSMSFIEGAALQLNYSTAWFSCYRVAIQPGDWVLVHGAAGGVGTAAIQVLLALGAQPIAIVSSSPKEAVAREVGAEHVLRSDGAWLDFVREITAGQGCAAVIDPVGGGQIVDSLRALDVGGRLAVVGFASGEIPEVRLNRLLLRDLSVVGVALAPYVERHPQIAVRLAEAIEAMARDGHLRPYVSEVLPLERTGEGLTIIDERRALGKVVIDVKA